MAEKNHPTTPDSGSPRTLAEGPKKKGPPRFLSFLCCGGSKAGEDDESLGPKPAKGKAERIPVSTNPKPDVSTAESSTAESKEPFNEKSGEPSVAGESSGVPAVGITPDLSSRDKPTPPLPGQAGHLNTNLAGPAIAVEAPTPVSPAEEQLIHDRTPEQEEIDKDIEMTDAGASVPIGPNDVQKESDATASGQPLHKDASQVKIDLPPPPPIEQRREQINLPKAPEVVAGQAVPEQKWLLPAIRPEHQGRKCLVLDLDETLVHSSFKVRERTVSEDEKEPY